MRLPGRLLRLVFCVVKARSTADSSEKTGSLRHISCWFIATYINDLFFLWLEKHRIWNHALFLIWMKAEISLDPLIFITRTKLSCLRVTTTKGCGKDATVCLRNEKNMSLQHESSTAFYRAENCIGMTGTVEEMSKMRRACENFSVVSLWKGDSWSRKWQMASGCFIFHRRTVCDCCHLAGSRGT